MRTDLISVVEAAYALHGDGVEWLQEICRRVRPALDTGFGVNGHILRMSRKGIKVESAVAEGCPPGLPALCRELICGMPPAHARRALIGVGPCETASEALGREWVSAALGATHGQLGIRDVRGLRAVNLDGSVTWLAACTPEVASTGRGFAHRWSRVAVHIAAGKRLRDRLPAGGEPGPDDLVLEANGTVAHAGGAARSRDAQEELRHAAVQIDRARGRMRRQSDEALELWQGLVRGRWSLVDQFDSDGRHYVLARMNPPGVVDPRALTSAERQVAAYAALGYSQKLIGYTLGISVSTVATHLRAALSKLGVRSRGDLAMYFEVRSPAKEDRAAPED